MAVFVVAGNARRPSVLFGSQQLPPYHICIEAARALCGFQEQAHRIVAHRITASRCNPVQNLVCVDERARTRLVRVWRKVAAEKAAIHGGFFIV